MVVGGLGSCVGDVEEADISAITRKHIRIPQCGPADTSVNTVNLQRIYVA
jgi:hypothetical protein